MKILLVLNLITGLVGCFDVIGYPGGTVEITYEHQPRGWSDKYFCKMNTNECIHVKIKKSYAHKDRLTIVDSDGLVRVIYRDLRLEDAGLYQFGKTGAWNHTVKLRVKTDPCCSGSKTVYGYLGETVTINCSYPKELQRYHKYFYKHTDNYFTEVISSTESEKGRFSISDDRRSRVLRVRISDVRDNDGGVYSCGVWIGGDSVIYETLFIKFHLQISDPGSSVMTTVSVWVCILLIGGLTLISYKLRGSRAEDFAFIFQSSETREEIDYEIDPTGNQNTIIMDPNTNRADSVYQGLNPNPNQLDSVYQSLSLNTNQSDSVYQSLNPNTNQSDSVYQSLNPNTNQSDSVYQSLNPNTNQPDSVYQSLNPNTHQSDSVYQSLNPNTHQSDSIYQGLSLNTNQSDSVYQSLNPNTNQSDSIYQSLSLNTNQSDSVYQSLNPNTNQSDSVYQSLNPNTNQPDSVYQSLNPNTHQSDSVN